MKRNTVKINESQLRSVIAKSIKKMLNESNGIENNSYGEDAWDEEEGDWVAWDNSRPDKPVDYGQELQPGFYVCEVGNYGDVQVSTTENLEEVEEALSASESAVFGPYSKEEAFKLAVNEVNNNWGFDFDGEWVRREFNDPADIEYYYSDKKWQEIAPGSQVNESKNMKKNTVKINESTLRRIITKSVKKVLKESDDFKPHGYKGTSNWGGYEMQISDRGDMARLRDSHTGKVSDWLEIQFDEDGVAYVMDANGNEERLCDYMRY